MKIFTVVGARPQFVKAAVLSREILKHSDIEEVLVHTGQHFDEKMSDVFFKEMDIPKPKYNLEINSLGHGAMTGRMLEGIEELLIKEKPDMVLVYGDTNSTLAGALAAKKLHIKVGHVEAGLRSFNMKMPEEVNRILTDRISDILFCPTQTAIDNLQKEGYDNINCSIENSGDVMQDAAYFYAKISENKTKVAHLYKDKKFVLATLHRAENTDNLDRLKGIVTALNKIAEEIEVVLPLHPRTQKIIAQNNLEVKFTTIDPVGYFDMIEFLKSCQFVMTDSGGLQKEAFFFKKFCITMRDQTEWVELVNHGFNVITGADTNKIIEAYKNVMNQEKDFNIDLYGGGKAGERIVNSLKNFAWNYKK